jgi:signal transduction histidine kinase
MEIVVAANKSPDKNRVQPNADEQSRQRQGADRPHSSIGKDDTSMGTGRFIQLLGGVSTQDFVEALWASLREPLVVLDRDLKVIWASKGFYLNFGLLQEETEARLIYDLDDGKWDIPELHRLLNSVVGNKSGVYDFRIDHDLGNTGRKALIFNAFPIFQQRPSTEMIILTISEVMGSVSNEQEEENLLAHVKESADGLAEAKEDIRVEVKEQLQAEPIDLQVQKELEKSESERILDVIAAKEVIRDEILEHKKTEEALMETGKQVRYLSSRLLEAQENERKMMARELHDGVGAGLTAIIYGLEELQEDASPDHAQHLKDLISTTRTTMEETRRISTDLRPSILDDMGLLATIRWFSRRFQGLHSALKIEDKLDIDEMVVPEKLKIVIYRVLQEALSNIAKHSGADHVRVSLRQRRKMVELSIEDNGKGFRVEEVADKSDSLGGMGLAGMRERTELSGGLFEISSRQGKGTTIRTSWPIT